MAAQEHVSLLEVATASLVAFECELSDQGQDAWRRSATIACNSGGIVVRSRPTPGSSCLTFMCSVTLSATVEQVANCMQQENRSKWDAQVNEPIYLSRFKGDAASVDVIGYATASAAAGLISGRSFIDLRITKHIDGEAGGVVSSSVAAPVGSDAELAACGAAEWLPNADRRRLVRARNLPGGGCSLRRRKLDDVRLVTDLIMISATEIGGRLPSYIVNRATAGALRDIFVKMSSTFDYAIVEE